MPLITLETIINAPQERVFDLARSIDAHMSSTKSTNELAVAGRTSGMIELDETVTWQARHFGIMQHLTVKITEFDRPNFFADEMITGAFKSMQHRHLFSFHESGTIMKDEFSFRAPLGVLGRIAEVTFLTKYMTSFLKNRNTILKKMAESDEWKKFLSQS